MADTRCEICGDSRTDTWTGYSKGKREGERREHPVCKEHWHELLDEFAFNQTECNYRDEFDPRIFVAVKERYDAAHAEKKAVLPGKGCAVPGCPHPASFGYRLEDGVHSLCEGHNAEYSKIVMAPDKCVTKASFEAFVAARVSDALWPPQIGDVVESVPNPNSGEVVRGVVFGFSGSYDGELVRYRTRDGQETHFLLNGSMQNPRIVSRPGKPAEDRKTDPPWPPQVGDVVEWDSPSLMRHVTGRVEDVDDECTRIGTDGSSHRCSLQKWQDANLRIISRPSAKPADKWVPKVGEYVRGKFVTSLVGKVVSIEGSRGFTAEFENGVISDQHANYFDPWVPRVGERVFTIGDTWIPSCRGLECVVDRVVDSTVLAIAEVNKRTYTGLAKEFAPHHHPASTPKKYHTCGECKHYSSIPMCTCGNCLAQEEGKRLRICGPGRGYTHSDLEKCNNFALPTDEPWCRACGREEPLADDGMCKDVELCVETLIRMRKANAMLCNPYLAQRRIESSLYADRSEDTRANGDLLRCESRNMWLDAAREACKDCTAERIRENGTRYIMSCDLPIWRR